MLFYKNIFYETELMHNLIESVKLYTQNQFCITLIFFNFTMILLVFFNDKKCYIINKNNIKFMITQKK